MSDRILSCVGLCRKAGKLIAGTELTVEAIRGGKIKLALLSSDASRNTEKRIGDCCSYRHVELIRLPYTSEALGAAVGKASTASAGITDVGFAEMIKKALQEQH